MVTLLKSLGWLTIAAGIILAFIYSNAQDDINTALKAMGAGSMTTPPMAIWIYWTVGGLASSMLWFALAQILQKQDKASSEREAIYLMLRGTDGETHTFQNDWRDKPAPPHVYNDPIPIKPHNQVGLIIGIIVVFALAAFAIWLKAAQ